MKAKPKLVQIKMPPATVEKMENLKEKSGLTSTTDVVKHSIGIFNWIIEQKAMGNEIYSISSDKKSMEKIAFIF